MGNDTERVPAVPGYEALDGAERFLRRFLVLPSDEAYWTCVLWAAHTWALDCFETTPRLVFQSREPGSGKSKGMFLTLALAARPKVFFNYTAPVLWQEIELHAPTLGLEEGDNVFMTDNSAKQLQGMLNGGFSRYGPDGTPVTVGRTNGRNANKEYKIFAAVALATLKPLPGPMASRSIHIQMMKATPPERYEMIRHRPLAEQTAAALAAWATSQQTQLSLADTIPELPENVEARAADIWIPLAAVADEAGGRWPERVRLAARYFTFGETSATVLTPGVRLLADIWRVWARDKDGAMRERMPTKALAALLLRDEPWSGMWTAASAGREIASALRGYDIQPGQWNAGPGRSDRGYLLASLTAAWAEFGIGVEAEAA